MAGYPAKSALKIKFLPEFRAFNYQIHESSIRRHIKLEYCKIILKKLLNFSGPLKFSNFFHDNRPDIRPDIRYPACRISGRISGTCNRISGRIPDSKKGRISGRISGRPDIRCNPIYRSRRINWFVLHAQQ